MKFKSLKKASAVLLCALITLAGVLNVFAAGQTYSIPEASNMQITLPEDMTAVTRSADANDKYFSLFGIDYNSTMQRFEASNIYLQGMNSSSDLVLTVTMTETEDSKNLGNYNQLEADKLSEIARNFLNQTEYTSCTVDQAVSNVVWLEFNTRVNNAGSLIEAYQANTVFDGQSINITLQRNGANVTADDYEVFSGIISSAEFHKPAFLNFSNPTMPYILIGVGVLIVLIIVFIIIIVRVAKRRRKKSKNDKILEELAGKYTTSRADQKHYRRDDDMTGSDDPVSSKDEEPYDLDSYGFEDKKSSSDRSYSDGYGSDRPAPEKTRESGRRYSDEEIDALLGDEGEKPNFIQALPKAPEEQTEAKDDTIDNTDQVSEFFEDEPSKPEDAAQPADTVQTTDTVLPETTKKFDFPVKSNDNPEEIAEELSVIGAAIAADQSEQTEEITESDEPAGELSEPIPEPGSSPEPEEESVDEPEVDTVEQEQTEEPVESEAEPEQAPEPDVIEAKPREEKENKGSSLRDEIRNALLAFDSDDENDEDDDDEVLVRDEAKRTKFVDSNDYFEEAPKKVIGVISSKDIQNAEEYDVIGEMERRADEVEKEPPQKGEAVTKALKSAGNGIKSFFVHCGYFITNVKRERQRKKAEEKRRQYEEDRKRRARERAERQRLQAENGGLVQVHKRTDRKPPQRRPSPQPQRRPGQKKRRPSSQQRRPANHQNRTGVPPRKR